MEGGGHYAQEVRGRRALRTGGEREARWCAAVSPESGKLTPDSVANNPKPGKLTP